MTTEQKLAHIQWYLDQVRKEGFMETQQHYISMARGAAGAWFADMTISHKDFKRIQVELNELVEGLQ